MTVQPFLEIDYSGLLSWGDQNDSYRQKRRHIHAAGTSLSHASDPTRIIT